MQSLQRSSPLNRKVSAKSIGMPDALSSGMSGIDRFDDLISWQRMHELNIEMWRATEGGPASKDFDFKHEIRDAADSAERNIAEGSAASRRRSSPTSWTCRGRPPRRRGRYSGRDSRLVSGNDPSSNVSTAWLFAACKRSPSSGVIGAPRPRSGTLNAATAPVGTIRTVERSERPERSERLGRLLDPLLQDGEHGDLVGPQLRDHLADVATPA
jgi:hypothetical protein